MGLQNFFDLLPWCVLGLALDALLGEPTRWHPLVGFGRAAAGLEQRANGGTPWRRRLLGAAAWLLLIAPLVGVAALLQSWLGVWVAAPLLYLALGGRSLIEHGQAVAQAFTASGLESAQERVGYMVSRDVTEMSEAQVIRATLESLLENGADAIFGALFWTLLLGAPGAVLYRLANTLDAMWGYRSARFAAFGWAAARADDALNLIPARLTALTYALCGDLRAGLRAWRENRNGKSPNSGVVMAAGAGALGLRLGGLTRYGDAVVNTPAMGHGRAPQWGDIPRAAALLRRGMALWGVVISLAWLA
ncbi:adenosylcobinamide-phosphate synthase CbiB [Magnetofaba australis]|nr:adenosylcobinamide-phosphate synthase CbiB [Magnetofaba australis]